MTEVLNCSLEVNEFKLQSRYYVHFLTNTLGKDMNPFISQTIGWVVLLLFFNKDVFGIK